MYIITDNTNTPLNVFSDQLSVVERNEFGFVSFVGSRKALEDIRKRITSSYWNDSIRFYNIADQDRSIRTRVYEFDPAGRHHKFFFRKLEDSTYWIMEVMSVDTYNCCQDLARGLKMSEKQRKAETAGVRMSYSPLTFIFKGNELFNSAEEMHQFLRQNVTNKSQILLNNPAFINALYRKIAMLSKTPILPEWMGPILHSTNINNAINLSTDGFFVQQEDIPLEDKIFTFRIYFNENPFANIISTLVNNKTISTGSEIEEGAITKVKSLTDYLNQFGDNLVQRAHERFEPLYTPGIDNPNAKARQFFLNTQYYSDLDYYSAQQDVICAVAKGLQKNKRTLIVGECGIGKTAIALASIYVHTQKKNPVVMVMCPGHMVEEWNKEINRLYPFARTKIIEKLNELEPYEDVIRHKKASAPLFLIFGKDSCKMDYEERPYLHWNTRRYEYQLPDKRSVNVKLPSRISGLIEQRAYLLTYFLKPGARNTYAEPGSNSIVYVCESARKKTKDVIKLWTATSEDTEEWVKIPKVGWVNKNLAKEFADDVKSAIANGQDVSQQVLKAYDIATAALGDDIAKPLIRCNISEYIRRRMKNCIDYFIADEVHLYSSKETAQGKAFANMVNTAKHTVALTGTLLNGYAENIFSMLFKLYSRTFVRNGFAFHDSREFAKEYGVVETIRDYDVNASGYEMLIKTTTKYKPGVSPLLFSKFLLDKAVFVTLADITADLPNYQEIPLGVSMDEATRTGYTKLVSDFKEAVRTNPDCVNKFLFKTIQRMNLYPDQPYNQVPIFNNDTGQQILCPVSVPRKAGEMFLSNKDKQLLEIIQKHKEAGEKVLVYVHWINRLDCVQRIQKMLADNQIQSAFLTASVSARERQKWIAQKLKEGIDVLICNPKLVETGLNLLEFTTIVFYQMDDQLFTLRQASRRSLRLNQSHDVTVYILYFKNTVQENILSLMAAKLQAAMAIEGKFSEEGLNAIGDTDSILTQLANNLIKDIDMKLETGAFDFHTIQAQSSGNRFKDKEKSVIHEWFYEIFPGKKKPKKVDLSCDLEQLKVS